MLTACLGRDEEPASSDEPNDGNVPEDAERHWS